MHEEGGEVREKEAEIYWLVPSDIATPVDVQRLERRAAAARGREGFEAAVRDIADAIQREEFEASAVLSHRYDARVVESDAPAEIQCPYMGALRRNGHESGGGEVSGAADVQVFEVRELGECHVTRLAELGRGVQGDGLNFLAAFRQENEALVAQQRAAGKVQLSEPAAVPGHLPNSAVGHQTASRKVEARKALATPGDIDERVVGHCVQPIERQALEGRVVASNRPESVPCDLVHRVQV